MQTADSNTWSELLNEAVSKPGLLLKAYSHFHRYSIGNQVLAISQCGQRGLEAGAMNTFQVGLVSAVRSAKARRL